MAKKEQQEVRNTARGTASNASETANADISGGGAFGGTGLAGSRGAAVDRQSQSFGSASQGFTEAQNTGGFDPNRLATVRSGTDNLALTGGFNPGQTEGVRTGLANASPTGGFDATQLAGLRGMATRNSENGGYDPENLSRITSGYQNFADNGGISETDAQNFRNRSNSGVSSAYKVLGEEAARRRTLTGGLGSGGETAQMARELSERQAQTNLNTESELAGLQRSGRLAGLGGLSSVASNVADNRQSGLTGAASLESSVAGGTRDILGQQANLESNIAAGIRGGVSTQAGVEGSVASGRLAGTAGQAQLFNASTGEISDTGRLILSRLGLQSADNATAMSTLQQLSMTPGLFDNIMKGIQVASGAAQAAFPGGIP